MSEINFTSGDSGAKAKGDTYATELNDSAGSTVAGTNDYWGGSSNTQGGHTFAKLGIGRHAIVFWAIGKTVKLAR